MNRDGSNDRVLMAAPELIAGFVDQGTWLSEARGMQMLSVVRDKPDDILAIGYYPKRPGTIVIKVTHNAPNVRLEFSDDGKGMDANQLARIFEPFYTTRRGEGGSGLGLYICYNIVTTQLGGTIVCHSQPETGCQFDIQFSARLDAKIEEGTP